MSVLSTHAPLGDYVIRGLIALALVICRVMLGRLVPRRIARREAVLRRP